jgi:hypothetical protein
VSRCGATLLDVERAWRSSLRSEIHVIESMIPR